jgi:hypothetical protein
MFSPASAQNPPAVLPPGDRYVRDAVVLKLKPGASPKDLRPDSADTHVDARATVALAALGVTILKVPEGKVSQVVAHLKQSPVVEFAEPNYGVLHPAAYANALAMAATDANDNRAWFSNYGPEVDLAAPGVGIYSTHWSSKSGSAYFSLSGTSMATPHVAGVAALLANLPQFNTPDKIRAALEGTALDLEPMCRDLYYGFGLV